MTWGFQSNLQTEAVADFVWIVTRELVYIDPHGVKWVVPQGFAFDKRSTPRWLWTWAPPSVGQADRAWCQHDFERRTHKLLGLKLSEVDLVRFRAQCKAVGKGRVRRALHSLAVWLGGNVTTPKGDGWHADNAYNTPVYDRTLRGWVTLERWVKSHYLQDGGGYIEDTVPVPS